MTEDAPRLECPVCKQILAPGLRFCPHDGTPLTDTSAKAASPTPSGRQSHSREIELPVLVGGRYRLVSLRGGGGMARVYRATDLTLGRNVAVKLINPALRNDKEFDSRFQREARIASQLADPHIVVVHDFGIDAEHGPYLVMEYLHGQSLREHLGSVGPLPFKPGLQLAAQLLLALIHAHERNVIHRDIKPENIFLLNQSGVRLHIRVLDFGIARLVRGRQNDGTDTLTSPGSVLGTPRYMAPEQLAATHVDARADLYSAAVVAHEALTGQLPYVSGQKLVELCPEAPPALQALLDRCLRPSPNERPGSALEVYLELQELSRASGVLLLPPGALDRLIAERRAEVPTIAAAPPPARPTAARTRRRVVAAGAMLLLVAASAASVWWLGGRKAQPVPQIETLLGVSVNGSFGEAIDRLNLTRGPAHPWEHGGQRPKALGRVLEAGDLQVPEETLPRVEVRWSADERVAVVGLGDTVRAVVAAGHRAATGRGVAVGAPVSAVYQAYDDAVPETHALPPDAGGHDEVRRYESQGVAFVIHKGRVASITLFPVRPSH